MASIPEKNRQPKTIDLFIAVFCGWMILYALSWMWHDFSRYHAATTQHLFRDVEATIAQRQMLDQMPEMGQLDNACHAIRLAKIEVSLTYGLALNRDMSILKTKFDELKTFKLDELDSVNRAKLERRLTVLEADPALRSATAQYLARRMELQVRYDRAKEAYRQSQTTLEAETKKVHVALADAAPFGRTEANAQRAAIAESRLATLKAQSVTAQETLDRVQEEKRRFDEPLAPVEKRLAEREAERNKLTEAFDRYGKVATSAADASTSQPATTAGIAKATEGQGSRYRRPLLDFFSSSTEVREIALADWTAGERASQNASRTDRCITCHQGIDRAEFERAMLGKLADTDESKRLTVKLAAARQQIDKRTASGEKLGFSPENLPGDRQGGVGLCALLLLLSVLVASVCLGMLEQSWRVGFWTLVVGLVLSTMTTAGLAYLMPRVPQVKALALSPGQITQYCVHPRLDLFVGPNSPHPMAKFGCVVCHAGQGASTEFGGAGHSPHDASQAALWLQQYGGVTSGSSDPMLAARFTEAACLKCHHQVTDLIVKGNKSEAPRLVQGYQIAQELGCFGCHDINGTKEGRHVGPDMRLEPSPALELLSVTQREKAKSYQPGSMRKVGPSLRRLAEKTSEEWTRKWVLDPRGFRDDTKMPHFYNLATNRPEALPDNQKAFPQAEIAAISHYLITESKNSLQGADFTRQMLLRGKSGLESLQARLVQDGLDQSQMQELLDLSQRMTDLALLSNPIAARLINDLADQQRQLQQRLGDIARRLADLRSRGTPEESMKATLSERAVPAAELAEVTAALVKASVPVKIGDRLIGADGRPVTLSADEKGNDVAGRLLFTEKGCLACHAHEGTTKAMKRDGKTVVYSVPSEANFGPELSRLAEKLAPSTDRTSARLWLVQWLLNPNVHSPRTRMPITSLTPQQANDIATWLLAHKSEQPWPVNDPGQPSLNNLVDLARVYLSRASGVGSKELDQYMPAGEKLVGIPPERVATMSRDADERILASDIISETAIKWYVGKKAIGKLGCYGCHDIPGFERSAPNGVALTDWGRKAPQLLPFEDGAAYVRRTYHLTPTAPRSRDEIEARYKTLLTKKERSAGDEREFLELEKMHQLFEMESRTDLDDKGQDELKKRLAQYTAEKPYEELFLQSLEQRRREGYLHLKLAEPDSFDYNRSRAWDERLRMPQFNLARTRRAKGESDAAFKARSDKEEAEAREAVMTFVLGLEGVPIPIIHRPQPTPERAAETLGRQVLDRFNCAACHQIRPGVYEFSMTPEIQAKLYEAFYKSAIDETAVANWLKDHVYLNHRAWVGADPAAVHRIADGARVTAYGYLDKAETEKSSSGDVIALTDALRFVGPNRATYDLRAGLFITLPRGSYIAHTGYGGTWTELMLPYLARKDATNFPATEPGKARGVLPPPLVREGERVQADWMVRFLLNPSEVRPANYMLLQMPRFNLSPDEARALVNYFVAVAKTDNPPAGLPYPDGGIDRRDAEYWKAAQERYTFRAKTKLAEAEKSLADPRNKAKEADLKKLVDGLKNRLNPPATAQGAARDPYSRSAFQLLTNKNLCISCHNVGSVTGQDPPKGPNLALAGERLRPEWTEQWIANPRRLFTYSPLMPQNFPNAISPLEWQYQDLFAGSPLEQTRAVRDLIMDTARLNDLAPTYSTPPPMPAGDEK